MSDVHEILANHRQDTTAEREAQRRWPDSRHGVLSSEVASQRHMARIGFMEGAAWQRAQLGDETKETT